MNAEVMKALSREDNAMNIPFNQLQLQATPIAAGAAGQVYKGTFCEATIAAKTLFSQMMRSADLSELIDEMHMLYQVIQTGYSPGTCPALVPHLSRICPVLVGRCR